MKVQKKRSVGIANWFYFFILSGPRSRPFLQELPNCTSPTVFPVILNHWFFFFYLIAGQSLWDICISRTLQMTVPSPVTNSGWRGRDHPQEQWGIRHQNLLGFSQIIPCCQDTLLPPPARPGRTRPAPCPASEDQGPSFLCPHSLTWHIWWQEQKLLIRENAVMRYFFFSSLPS